MEEPVQVTRDYNDTTFTQSKVTVISNQLNCQQLDYYKSIQLQNSNSNTIKTIDHGTGRQVCDKSCSCWSGTRYVRVVDWID
jgi:hypothetical protein